MWEAREMCIPSHAREPTLAGTRCKETGARTGSSVAMQWTAKRYRSWSPLATAELSSQKMLLRQTGNSAKLSKDPSSQIRTALVAKPTPFNLSLSPLDNLISLCLSSTAAISSSDSDPAHSLQIYHSTVSLWFFFFFAGLYNIHNKLVDLSSSSGGWSTQSRGRCTAAAYLWSWKQDYMIVVMERASERQPRVIRWRSCEGKTWWIW